MFRRYLLLSIAASLSLGAPSSGIAETATAPKLSKALAGRVNELLGKIETAPTLAERWAAERALEKIGAQAIPLVKERLPSFPLAARLPISKFLFKTGSTMAGARIIQELLDSDVDTDLLSAAAELLASFGPPGGEPEAQGKMTAQLCRTVKQRLASAKTPALRVNLVRALWAIGLTEDDQQMAFRAALQLLDAEDEGTRLNAALALAEMRGNRPIPAKAVTILECYEAEPTPLGRRISALLQLNRLVQYSVREPQYERTLGAQLIEEIRKKVQENYVDKAKTRAGYLVESAAKGLVRALDRFSAYMTAQEWKAFREGMSGHYAGIGASVRAIKNKIYIMKAFFNGPAYRAGIRSRDQIIAVDGENVEKKTLDAVVSKLRGRPGSAVKIKIKRRRVQQLLEFQVKREQITTPSVYHAVLPGRLGYVRLTGFGNTAAQEVHAALVELAKAPGIRGLIFDLRGNPGGLLDAAVKIAGEFLESGQLVAVSEGRNKAIAPRQEYRVPEGATSYSYPLVVLVNGGSASASEIVAGALNDHKRAALVGEKTFGKGSVQKLMPLQATRGTSALRLTIAKYYLPLGESIHEKGIEPDIKVKPRQHDSKKMKKLFELPEEPFEDYYLDRKANFNAVLYDLAENDEGSWKKYPQFDQWFATLGTSLPKQLVRYRLRSVIRRLVADERGKDFVYDIVEDVQLQAAIKELARRLSIDLSRFEYYDFFLKQ